MKGIMFNLLEDVVVDQFDLDAWDDVLEHVGATGAYTSVAHYDDGELRALVGGVGNLCAIEDEHVSDAAAFRWFGERAMEPLSQRYPAFFEPHERTLDFVLTLNDVIHAEVLKSHPDADVPIFTFSGVERDADVESVTLHYSSRRRLCALAEGFTIGAAHRYGERATVHHAACVLDGHPECEIVCRFERSGASGRS